MSDVRLIDATRLEEAFAKECTAECPICSYYKSDAEVDVECHCGLINNAPTIAKCGRTSDGFPFMDLRPRPHGRWEKIAKNQYRCTNCKEWDFFDYQEETCPNFCPNCGAKMKGE